MGRLHGWRRVWEEGCLSGIPASRTGLSLGGEPQGDDQGRDEHRAPQLLARLPRGLGRGQGEGAELKLAGSGVSWQPSPEIPARSSAVSRSVHRQHSGGGGELCSFSARLPTRGHRPGHQGTGDTHRGPAGGESPTPRRARGGAWGGAREGGAREGGARGGSQGHSGPAPRARRPRWS